MKIKQNDLRTGDIVIAPFFRELRELKVIRPPKKLSDGKHYSSSFGKTKCINLSTGKYSYIDLDRNIWLLSREDNN